MEEVKKEKELKKNKKKNKVASLLLALALILTCGVAGTIAQYQKSFDGNATASVAKFNVSQTGISNKQVDLFATNILDEDSADNYEEKEVATSKIAPGTMGYTELSVTNNSEVAVDYTFTLSQLDKNGNAINTQNPHINGDGWQISYQNSAGSTETALIPLEFGLYVPNPSGSDPLAGSSTQAKGIALAGVTYSDFTTLTQNSNLSDTISLADGTTPKKVYLCWRWKYDNTGNDSKANDVDTAIGEDLAKTAGSTIKPVVGVELKVTQKD